MEFDFVSDPIDFTRTLQEYKEDQVSARFDLYFITIKEHKSEACFCIKHKNPIDLLIFQTILVFTWYTFSTRDVKCINQQIAPLSVKPKSVTCTNRIIQYMKINEISGLNFWNFWQFFSGREIDFSYLSYVLKIDDDKNLDLVQLRYVYRWAHVQNYPWPRYPTLIVDLFCISRLSVRTRRHSALILHGTGVYILIIFYRRKNTLFINAILNVVAEFIVAIT